MLRIELILDKPIRLYGADILKDCIINGLEKTDIIPASDLIGRESRHLSFGAEITTKKDLNGNYFEYTKRIIIQSIDSVVSNALNQLNVKDLTKKIPFLGGLFSLQNAKKYIINYVEQENYIVKCYQITPMFLSAGRNSNGNGLKIIPDDEYLSRYISHSISKKVGKEVSLSISPDKLYIRGRNNGFSLLKYRQVRMLSNGTLVARPGLIFPYELTGSPEDIKLAWYAGLGGRNKLGFGIMDLMKEN